MSSQDQLIDLTEVYLKRVFVGATNSLDASFDSFTPFGDLGIHSFQVLKVLKCLEADFGPLAKSLLFEHFTIDALAGYFVAQHGETLRKRFVRTVSDERINQESPTPPLSQPGMDASFATSAALGLTELSAESNVAPVGGRPLHILERDALADASLASRICDLRRRYDVEGGVSRGTRKIAPWLLLASSRLSFLNYGLSGKLLLVYSYTGPQALFPELLEEICLHCDSMGLELNCLSIATLETRSRRKFSATPFGVLQRIFPLSSFSLDGGHRRKLRNAVAKFRKSGVCRTEEYRCGHDPSIDIQIASVVDRWAATKTMVNPLVDDARNEIITGTLSGDHRIFLTWLDDVLQNVVLITAMCEDANGYLMDLEFYPPDMPRGGLEHAIIEIIGVLAAEGRELLSLGGTYGCRIEAGRNADPAIGAVLDELRENSIFNGEGNLQFKNKFGPETKTIFLCRPEGSGSADSVMDIIMMIAQPVGPTADISSNTHGDERPISAMESSISRTGGASAAPANDHDLVETLSESDETEIAKRRQMLGAEGWNPLRLEYEHIDFDLKTDSWSQLQTPFISAHIRRLRTQLHQPVDVEGSLQGVFALPHVLLTESGQASEALLFKAWPRRGVVLANLLFPSTIFHLIDHGFSLEEIPHPEALRADGAAVWRGDLDVSRMADRLDQNADEIAFVLIELGNNATGGQPVSLENVLAIKELLKAHSIPVVMEVTRILENSLAQLHECKDSADTVWTVTREMLSHADVVLGSLTKDFCVSRGGVVAVRQRTLLSNLQQHLAAKGSGIDSLDRKMIGLSIRTRRALEERTRDRVKAVDLLWTRLSAIGVHLFARGGGHCVVVDLGGQTPWAGMDYPAASFVSWLYIRSGIRCAEHSVGLKRNPNLVRFAVPVGMTIADVEEVASRIAEAMRHPAGLLDLTRDAKVVQKPGAGGSVYKLRDYDAQASADRLCNTAGAHTYTTLDRGRALVTATKLPEGRREQGACECLEPATQLVANEASLHSGIAVQAAPLEARVRTECSGAGAGEDATQAAVGAIHSERPLEADPQSGQIAIIGVAGRYPKADSPRELWENISMGRDCIEELPPDRFERRRVHGPALRYRGGFLNDIDRFDSLFFNISPREAEMLDPQERLFLEVAWEAVEDAGYFPEILAKPGSPRDVGVFVGAVWTMYQMLGVEEKHAGGRIVPNSFLWSIANRVSYWMNLEGPSLTIDTACSSSLTALYLGCESILRGECSTALVGGVNLDLHQAKLDINLAGGALSPDSVCRSFGTQANGYVAGEGVGVVLLKPLAQAITDGDHIYGLIKGAAINHGGRTSGYTVPNPKAQTGVIRSALRRAGIDATSIGYVEAHGTGTELGDPIEIAGLADAYGTNGQPKCAIGSVKSNIGHLEAAAGIVSLTKVLLQMQYRQIAPSLHSAELNPWIDFKQSPFFVPQTLLPWHPVIEAGEELPLRAGVSSFGAGGSNAHVLLESYRWAEKGLQPSVGEMIFPVSGRTDEQLSEVVTKLLNCLRKERIREDDLAFTLQSGRKAFEYRAAFVASGQDSLCHLLEQYLAGERGDNIVFGSEKNSEAVNRLLSRSERGELLRFIARSNDPHRIAQLWADGLLVEWPVQEGNRSARRVSLPTYPFAKKRHWPTSVKTMSLHLGAESLVKHPLIDSNESTFNRQLFKKTFSDRDFFIYDHLVGDVPTLPGVAYLEFARKAGELATGSKVRKIKNVLWLSPITVEKGVPREVWIELKPERSQVRFDVFSISDDGKTVPHSQGTLIYSTSDVAMVDEPPIDLAAVRARSRKVIHGEQAYPKFAEVGLRLGRSFQVLKDVLKNQDETLGELELPEERAGELALLELHPSLIDGSLQAGMSAQLGESVEEMYVPFSLGEVEILHPLTRRCYSFVTRTSGNDQGRESRLVRSDVLIVDETGKVLVRIRESIGVPLREVQKQQHVATSEAVPTLFYGYDWEPSPLPVGVPVTLGKGSLLFVPNSWRASLRELAPDTTTVVAGDAFCQSEANAYTVSPLEREDYGRLLLNLKEQANPLRQIYFFWPVATDGVSTVEELDAALEMGLYPFLFLCQALVERKLEGEVSVLYVHATGQYPSQPQHEAIRGFINALRLEYPKLHCRSIAVQAEMEDLAELLRTTELEITPHEQDVAPVSYEGGIRYVRRLKFLLSSELGRTGSDQFLPRSQGVYLITGGAGGLGLLFAEFLARSYNARLLLMGRSIPSPAQEDGMQRIRDLGSEVEYVLGDVTKVEDVQAVVSLAESRWGALNGILHTAGVLRDTLMRTLSIEQMKAVLLPKVHGTRVLDEVTKDVNLDFFVLFSSLAALTGNAGQSNYSFANHFMDAFAEQRDRLRAAGVRKGQSLSFNWSLWDEGGMTLDEQALVYFRKTMGISPIRTRTGMASFLEGLRSGRSQLAVVEGDQDKIEKAWGLHKKKTAEKKVGLVATRDHRARLEGDLAHMVADFLKLDVEDMDPEKILLDLGFDSIGLTTFANAVNERFGLDITPVLFFDYPSVREIAKHLVNERATEIDVVYGPAGTPVNMPASVTVPNCSAQNETEAGEVQFAKRWHLHDTQSAPMPPGPDSVEREALGIENRFRHTPIAIVGMSGVMPQSDDLREFWANLRDAKSMISVVPEDRWNWEEFYGDPLTETNKTDSKWGGFMREVDKFDPLFFSISPREAQVMDPQQRIFLEQVWKAIEDSGHKVSELSGTRTGLFVGVATNDYIDLMNSVGTKLTGYTASGNSHSVLANRVSFLLNLHGPSAPIDTACSSSLIALHRAVESIHTGSCEMAIVGGVQVMMSPAAYISFSMAGMLSKDGRCKTFDKSADGYVRGEGAGAIFLKTLAAAERDGDHVYAVIRSTAENHGGRVTTLTAPNSVAQAALLVEAYDKGGVDPATVGYIECHGTGTSLGDPIEIQALSKAFAELYRRNGHAPATVPHCGLSAVKTNIGHLETAAGIAGILKVLLALQHRQIPAVLNFKELNPFVQLKGTPFYIAEKLTPWQAAVDTDGTTQPRRAGISSFGFGGANAHIVLEEYVEHERTPSVATEQLIVVSAKTEERLKIYLQALLQHLESDEPNLEDLAYTLQVGRDEMNERIAILVADMAGLKRRLHELVDLDTQAPSTIYRGQVRPGNISLIEKLAPAVEVCSGERDLSGLAALWVQGASINWGMLYLDRPRRLSLPTYPFARERHWISLEKQAPTSTTGTMLAADAMFLHPMVQRNVSTLAQQKFASRFTGEEFFFVDHRVAGRKILPGVAYLEMARAAGSMAGLEPVRALRDVLWERPLLVLEQAEDVEIVLIPDEEEILFTIQTVGETDAPVFCSGRITPSSHDQIPIRNLDEIRARCPQRVLSAAELYPLLHDAGLDLGKSFRIVGEIYANPAESLATLALPEHLRLSAGSFELHPALMDGSLHTAIGLMKANGLDVPLSIPYSVGRVEIFDSLEGICYGYATWASGVQAGERRTVNFELLDADGRVLVRMQDFVSRPISKKPSSRRAEVVGLSSSSVAVDWGLECLVSEWVELSFGESVVVGGEVVLVGGGAAELAWLRASFPGARHVVVDGDVSVGVLSERLRSLLGPSSRLVWMSPATGDPVPLEEMTDRQGEGVVAVFRLVKALLELGYGSRGLDWTVITLRTQEVRRGEAVDPTHAALVGLMGSVAKEYGGWTIRLLDVPSLDAVSAAVCCGQPADRQGDVRAFRDGRWYGQRLVDAGALDGGLEPAYREGGVYVVVGGAGGIGQVWTRHVMERYGAEVVWVGRRAYTEAVAACVAACRVGERTPLYLVADATDEGSLCGVRAEVLARYGRVTGVVHSALVLADGSVARMEEAALRAGLAAKLDVSVNLERVFGQDGLELMLYFSSVVSFFKTPGQSNYAAGCTFQDSFAQWLRQHREYAVKTMHWGYWGEVGVAASPFYRERMAQLGIGSLHAEESMAALDTLLRSEQPQLVLIKTNTRTTDKTVKSIQQHGVETATLDLGEQSLPLPSLQSSKTMLRVGEGRNDSGDDAALEKMILRELSGALNMETALIRTHVPFADYGIDSITGISFVRALNAALHIDLGPAILFEYTTVSDLATYLHAQGTLLLPKQPNTYPASSTQNDSYVSGPDARMVLSNSLERAKSASSKTSNRLSRDSTEQPAAKSGNEQPPNSHIHPEAIAIIGISGVFASSNDLNEFWEHLLAGHDLVTEVKRWNPEACALPAMEDRPFCNRGSFLDNIDEFDAEFFGITPLEATYMDPQQRLLLETGWHALEDAGYAGDDVHETECGIYVGCGTSNYEQLFGDDAPAQAWWGNASAVAPARIAYHLHLQGPAIAVDTACSSSLVAMHLACQGLWSGETSMALAGGVYVEATPGFHQVANRAGMLSPSGNCRSFDAAADGFVPGEGVGVVVLKRLSDAVRDGDFIHAAIVASGINQNGKSNGLVAPNGRAQERLAGSVYERFHIQPESLQMLEAHGTGTLIGDSIEFNAMRRVFEKSTDQKHFCSIGSVKSNVGHGATAAGVTSVLKTILALKHEAIPPSLHFESSNPLIDLTTGPFFINTEAQPWHALEGVRRRAAVSSFGFSGTNAHIVLEEAPSREPVAEETFGSFVVLSGRSWEQVRVQVTNLITRLKAKQGCPSLSINDMAYTLLVGRTHLSHRLAAVAHSPTHLLSILDEYLRTGSSLDVVTAAIRADERTAIRKFGNYAIEQCQTSKDAAQYLEHMHAVADLFVQGYKLDYKKLFPKYSRRIPLPGYPFARERYWIDRGPVVSPVTNTSDMAAGSSLMRGQELPAKTELIQTRHIDEGMNSEGRLISTLIALAASLLHVEEEQVDPDAILLDMGFDSQTLTSFAELINGYFGLILTPIVFFDHFRLADLAKYLVGEYGSGLLYSRKEPSSKVIEPMTFSNAVHDQILTAVAAEPTVFHGADLTQNRFVDMPIAIVGMSGVMPRSSDLDDFWGHLKASDDLISVVPEDRWSWQEFDGDPLKEANKSSSRWGGFINEIDTFDRSFFTISQKEAEMMDPQQRIFLEHVWKAIEDSGHRVSDFSGTRTGVFVGVASNEYIDVLADSGTALDAYTISGNSHSVLANRVSYLLNLKGPSSPIDTACSSSLIALHRAVESIHTGSCNAAIVGGVQLMLSPAAHISFSIAGMLSSDGRCKTFDKRADGYVRGEGAGVVVLKPLAAAQADGDHIYAVIKATAENHGGRVPTMTAPNSAAQSELLVEAYQKACIDVSTVGYIECHGTGTSLGDPIEVQALGNAFAQLYRCQGKTATGSPHCALGSVKTNIGHLETAAGIAGVIKVLLSIRHGEIPGTPHFQKLNPYIQLKGTPFYIADKLRAWPSPLGETGELLPRRAGVSSFGFGGANAHVVLEEYIPLIAGISRNQRGTELVLLSAKDPDRLQEYAVSLRRWLDTHDASLQEVAYTLQVGRDEMPERLAIVAMSTADLREKLSEFITGNTDTTHIVHGRVSSKVSAPTKDRPASVRILPGADHAELARLWVRGHVINWNLLHVSPVRRISLPSYPFARERCWVPVSSKVVNPHQPSLITMPEVVGLSSSSVAVDWGLECLVSEWVELSFGESVVVGGEVVLVGGGAAELAWLRASFPGARHVVVDGDVSVGVLSERLRSLLGPSSRLVWMSPATGDPVPLEEMTDRQGEGVVAVFRLVKALLELGYGSRGLDWTVITLRTQEVRRGEAVDPTHAALVGLMGSVAKEYGGWTIRLLDVPSLDAVSAAVCCGQPADRQGDVRAFRDGRWYGQRLVDAGALDGGLEPAYREGGVYVVVGGAGGIGQVWTRHVMERYGAEVVWVGRRAYTEAVAACVAACRVGERTPLYLVADATDEGSLCGVRAEVLARYGRVTGVVHSALVLADGSVARMEEAALRAGLAAKLDVSVNLERVFGQDGLELMLYFSSVVSFFKTPGQSNYAAGCTFQDSFAQWLRQHREYAVKTMHWGYWGEVGVAASPFYRERMAQLGIGSLHAEESMAALDTLLRSEQPQLVLIKTNTRTTEQHRQMQDSCSSTDINETVVVESSDKTTHLNEKLLLELWEQVLPVTPGGIGVQDSFFELGGDSLLATQMLSRVRAEFSVDLSLMSLFQNATIEQFVKLLSETGSTVTRPILPLARPESGTFALGFAQERIWFYNQLEPDSPQHNMPVAVTVPGTLRMGDLRRAFEAIINRHEILRTIFPADEGEGRQKILETSLFPLEHVDLCRVGDTSERDRKAKEICQAEAARPFHLDSGPLLRGLVISLNEREYILMVNMHHIIGDGWSMGVLIRELTALMDGFATGTIAALPSLPIQYIDFSEWQRAWLTESGNLERQLTYWQHKLAGSSVLPSMDADRPNPVIPTRAGASITFLFDSTLLGRMKRMAEGQGATLFMLLVAGWKVLMYRHSGQDDICIATLIAGRQYAETENLIGMFVNTLALRDRLDGEITFVAFLEQVKNTCLEAYRHQDVPYDKVVERLRRENREAANPASQVMLVLQNTEIGDAGKRFPRYSFDSDTTEFELNLEFTEGVAGLLLTAQYSTELYQQQTIQCFADDFANLMHEAVQAPGRVIDAFNISKESNEISGFVDYPPLIEERTEGSSYEADSPVIRDFTYRGKSVRTLNATTCCGPGDSSLLQAVIFDQAVLDDGYERMTF